MMNQKYINVKILPISPNFIEIGRILMLKIKLNVNESGTNWEKTSWADWIQSCMSGLRCIEY